MTVRLNAAIANSYVAYKTTTPTANPTEMSSVTSDQLDHRVDELFDYRNF